MSEQTSGQLDIHQVDSTWLHDVVSVVDGVDWGTWRQKTAAIGMASLALATVYEYGPADETRDTPFFVSGDHSIDYPREQLRAAQDWAVDRDVTTFSEGNVRSNSASAGALGEIESKRDATDYSFVGSFSLPNYPVDVVVMSEDSSMLDRLSSEVLEEVMMWSYRNAELIDIDQEVRQQAVDSLNYSHQFIRDGGLDSPFLLVLPGNFDESCIRNDQIVSPASKEICSRNGEANVSPLKWWRYGLARYTVTSGNKNTGDDIQEKLAATIAHEFAHFVDFKQRGLTYMSLDEKNNEAYGRAVEIFMSDNFDMSGQQLISMDE